MFIVPNLVCVTAVVKHFAVFFPLFSLQIIVRYFLFLYNLFLVHVPKAFVVYLLAVLPFCHGLNLV